MPKQKSKLTQEEQSKRFKDAAESLIKDGDLDPEEADRKLKNLITKVSLKPDLEDD